MLEAEGHTPEFGLTSVKGLFANDLGHHFLTERFNNHCSIRIEQIRHVMGHRPSLASADVEPAQQWADTVRDFMKGQGVDGR